MSPRGEDEVSAVVLMANNIGELASALDARNKIDECLYKKMDEREKRMEEMVMSQQIRYHKLLWAMVILNAILAGANVMQLTGLIGG